MCMHVYTIYKKSFGKNNGYSTEYTWIEVGPPLVRQIMMYTRQNKNPAFYTQPAVSFMEANKKRPSDDEALFEMFQNLPRCLQFLDELGRNTGHARAT